MTNAAETQATMHRKMDTPLCHEGPLPKSSLATLSALGGVALHAGDTHRDSIPRADKHPVESLVRPELPDIVEPKCSLSDTDATPRREQQDEEGVLISAWVLL